MYVRVKCGQCQEEIGGQDVLASLGVQDKHKRVNQMVDVSFDLLVLPHACDPLRKEKPVTLDTTAGDLAAEAELESLSKKELIAKMAELVPAEEMPGIRRLSKAQLVEELTEEMRKL